MLLTSHIERNNSCASPPDVPGPAQINGSYLITMKQKYFFLLTILSFLVAAPGFDVAPVNEPASPGLHTINTRNANDLKAFFRYTTDRLPFISAHRGGPRRGFPENCIATFENTLTHGPAILEIDPRYTKDGHIVLMHDATLDRTTNGTGKVADHTLAEIRALRLKDTEGNLTDFRIPTLDEALQWAKGKTILVIDAKDVPIEERAQRILDNKAEGNAILISYSLEDTKKVYRLSRDIVMEVMMGKMDNVSLIDNSGVPWENVVGFVSHNLPEDRVIFDAVHDRGAMCIQGSSRNYDRRFMADKIDEAGLAAGYRSLIEFGADIIEADLSVEAISALKPLQGMKSSKSRFFKSPKKKTR